MTEHIFHCFSKFWLISEIEKSGRVWLNSWPWITFSNRHRTQLFYENDFIKKILLLNMSLDISSHFKFQIYLSLLPSYAFLGPKFFSQKKWPWNWLNTCFAIKIVWVESTFDGSCLECITILILQQLVSKNYEFCWFLEN